MATFVPFFSVAPRSGTLPSYGFPFEVVEEGTGRVPTLNDRVKFDYISWSDAFDGQNKAYDYRGLRDRVSDWADWLSEALLSMKVGEVRQIKLSATYVYYVQLRLISIE